MQPLHRTFASTLLCIAWMVSSAAPAIGAESREGMLRFPADAKSNTARDARLTAGPVWEIALAAPKAAKLKQFEEGLKQSPVQIGFPRHAAKSVSREVVSDRPEWLQRADGGWSITIKMTSKAAPAVRAGIDIHRAPPGSRLTFFDGNGELLMTRLIDRLNRLATRRNTATHTHWSPTSVGDSVYIEVSLPPGHTIDSADFTLGPISHLVVSPFDAEAMRGVEKMAGACNLDVVCYAQFDQLRAAVSRMVFSDNGSTFTCTGQLLNNGDANAEPYYLSANHCLSRQAVADTLETIWYQESPACNAAGTSDAFAVVRGGAELLTTELETDTTLFLLRESPNFPVFYAGWSTELPGGQITGIHHPQGDRKKVSFGEITGFTRRSTVGSVGVSSPEASFIVAQWSQGTTEGGSSGSAIYDQEQRVIGTLFGGAASCSNLDGPDFYGRFDRAFSRNNWSAFLALASNERRLSVTKNGLGEGLVASSAAGISCGLGCTSATAAFPAASTVTLTATPSGSAVFGGWSAGSCTSNPTPNQCTVSLAENSTVTATFTIDLSLVASAINDSGASNGLVLGGEGAAWLVDTSTFASGTSSAASADINDDELSALSTQLTGPGELDFAWRVSSEANFDFLTVMLDGVTVGSISGERDWQPASTIDIPAGLHTVTWTYIKDFSISTGDDRGWIDNVVYSSSAVQPPPPPPPPQGEPGEGSRVLDALRRLRQILGD